MISLGESSEQQRIRQALMCLFDYCYQSYAYTMSACSFDAQSSRLVCCVIKVKAFLFQSLDGATSYLARETRAVRNVGQAHTRCTPLFLALTNYTLCSNADLTCPTDRHLSNLLCFAFAFKSLRCSYCEKAGRAVFKGMIERLYTRRYSI